MSRILPALALLLIASFPVHAGDLFLRGDEPVFPEVQPDRSLVYFAVAGGTKSMKQYEVYIDSVPIGYVPEQCYTSVSIEPGLRHVWGSGFSHWFVFSPGRVYLLRADRGAGTWFLDDPGRIRELVAEFQLAPVTATEAGLASMENGLENYGKYRAKRLREHEKVAQGAGRPSDATLPVKIKLAMTYKEKLGEKKFPGFGSRCKLTVTKTVVNCRSNKIRLEIPAEDILGVSFGGLGGELPAGSPGAAWIHVRYKGSDGPKDAFFSSPLGIGVPNDYNIKFAAISDAMELTKR